MMSPIIRILTATLFAAAVAAMAGCGGSQNGEVTVDTLFARAQVLQGEDKWDEAVRLYRKIAREYPQERQGANSQFMVGYIYANNLKDYKQAEIELNRFLDEYAATADSGLVVGARFELQNLGKNIDEIPALSDIGSGDAGTDTAAAGGGG